MGLRDKLKKKSVDAEKPEEIGGMLADKSMSEIKGSSEQAGIATQDTEDTNEPFAQGFPDFNPEPVAEPAAEKKDNALSSLDIFNDEDGEEEDGLNLAKQLPEIDIHELLKECQDIAAQFKEKIG